MEKRVVLCPAPFIGHIMSMIELGKLLLSQSPSCVTSITILVPSCPLNTLDSCSSYLSSVSSSFPSITFIFLPPPPPLFSSLSVYADFEHICFETLRSNNPKLLQSLHSLSLNSAISAFVLDLFCYSALEVSLSLGLPSYFFIPSSASTLAFLLNFPVYDSIYPDSLKNLQAPLQIPGLFSVPTTHMIDCMIHRGVSYYEYINLAKTLTRSNGIIINSFESLEVRAVKGLKQGTCLPGTPIPPVYCIGPLIANRDNYASERHECLSWLDSQPSRSVVYLCFGSGGIFSKEQIMEIALGLERSGVRFLWVVRAPPPPPPSENSNKNNVFLPLLHEPNLEFLLPKEFLDRTKNRGHVVKLWVPQIQVLAHESIGAFVTHCGWNSILEGICACLPLVAWPLYAEQRFNKILLVEEIGIAIPMDESEDRFVSSIEVEKRVKQIMSLEGNLFRKRVLDLKEKAKVALSVGGSSNEALTSLIQSWN